MTLICIFKSIRMASMNTKASKLQNIVKYGEMFYDCHRALTPAVALAFMIPPLTTCHTHIPCTLRCFCPSPSHSSIKHSLFPLHATTHTHYSCTHHVSLFITKQSFDCTSTLQQPTTIHTLCTLSVCHKAIFSLFIHFTTRGHHKHVLNT